ncbi:MAG: carbohydrate-binding protein, partial [Chitinophagaceae bacterium]
MRIFTLSLISILFSSVAFFSPGASAQSVLNPADSVRTYDSTARPIQPPSGQIGKWVRTRILDWNTNSYKAYIYKGVAFRLRFPKTYIPAVADGKKYPMMAFFHGLGEASPIYDNEFHLLHGGQFFDENINSGNFDGYVLAMQSTGFFGGNHYQYLTEIIEYMIANNKLDPFAITANGLSAGGQASWEMAINFPTYISGAAPLSWSSIQYTQAAVVDKLKYTRLWVFQGSLDGNPAPSTTYQVRDAIKAAGGHFKLTEYPNVEHWTWDRAWREPDFFPFIKRAYSSNPYPKGGISQFLSGEVINASLGLAPGFAGYQWRKDGVVLTGATQNILLVNQFGTYDARVLRNGIWSEWSRIPVVVQIKDPFVPIPEKIEAEEWTAMSGVQNENTSDAEGGLNVAFVDAADWMDYSVKAPTAGKYSLKLRLASPNTGGEIQIRGTGGSLLATVAVPNTGGYQNWTTVYAIVTLPVGNQTIRITSTAGGWNFNWIEFLQGVVNQPPTSDAGPNVTIYLPQTTVALNGAGADADGFVGSFNWSKIYGPAAGTFTNPLSAQTSVTGLAQATYVFRLTVTDNLGIFSIDDVTVIVNPAVPPASGTRIEAENHTAMNGIQIEGTADLGGGLNVGWIDNNDWMDYSFTAPTAGTYAMRFRIATPLDGAQLQVRNAEGTVLATVNVANTGGWQSWQTVTSSIVLPQGTQTFRIVSTAAPSWNINWMELGSGTTAPSNVPPTANAGSDKTITLPVSSVQLSGSASDADGTVATLRWTKVSGPASGTFSDNTVATTTVSGLTAGTYVYRLTATDNSGAAGFDDVSVIVNPAVTPPPPPPPASTSTHIEAEHYATMSGVLTENTGDVGGGINVGWIDNTDWMDYSFTAPAAGTYAMQFRIATPLDGAQLQVRKADGTVLTTINVINTGGWQSWQTMTSNIVLPQGTQTFRVISTAVPNWNINWMELSYSGTAPSNVPPTANAGSDKTITLPVSSVQLSGSASDADGTVATLRWTKVSGPASGTFSDNTVATTTVSGLTAGTYVYRLTATDNSGAAGFDDVSVIVNPAVTPPPPPPPASTSTHIEAELYTTMSGVLTENTGDVGGGINVGWIDFGDWMDYTYNAPSAGTYNIMLRIANPNTGSQLQLRKADGSVFSTVSLPNTGSYQGWQTVTTVVTLAAGPQSIRIISTNSGNWNINWLDIVAGGTPPANSAPTVSAGSDKTIAL